MIVSIIIALFYAAVKNTGRLRFFGDNFSFIFLSRSRRPPETAPENGPVFKSIPVFVFPFLLSFFLLGCSAGTGEPVLEEIDPGQSAERVLEQETAGAGLTDDRFTDDRSTDGHLSGDRSADDRVSDGHLSGDRSADGRVSDGHLSGDRLADSRVSGDRPAEKEEISSGKESDAEAGSMDEEVQESLLTVHVCGAVRREGVYSLPAGSRIRDAVDAAGGFSGDADRSCLNLAMKIEDAWQIRVPTKEEAEALRLEQGRSGAGTAVPGASPGLSGTSGLQGAGTAKDEAGKGNQEEKINLNTASKEQLMKIPGVGEAKAQRIIEYREQNGRFEAIEDLMKVPGIKDASFQKMKDYITV